MFPEREKPTPKRFKGKDWETELEISKWLHRPMRYYTTDPPFYPWLPPEPLVNFDLVSAYNKGQH